ncbi:MAG: DUF2924 domain-containing protein [Proteobacteria bacterium]|nr:DUF2924 domain-containing protein [Pseudomonadota bacterium]
MKVDQHPASVAAQVAALPNLPMDELWALWDSFYRKRPGTWSRDYVASRLAYKIQEQAFGGIDPDIHRRLLRMGETQSKLGQRSSVDSQLLPGTVLLREWGETSYRVTVTPDGRFEMGGKIFKSLSAASRHITGTNWSGPAFFGLVKKIRKSS